MPGETRRELDNGDVFNTNVNGNKRGIVVLYSPSDSKLGPLTAWNHGVIQKYYGGSPTRYVDAIVGPLLPYCTPRPQPSSIHANARVYSHR